MENINPGSNHETEAQAVPAKKANRKIAPLLKKIFSTSSLSQWLPTVIIAAVFLVVAYYLIFPSRGYFHADCTDTLVWAAASYESGHIFDPDCKYACLLPFGGSLLMLPFYGMFGFSMTTHLIGMFLFLIIFSTSLLFLLKAMKWNKPWTAVMYTAVMLTVSSSEKLREIFWGHIIYYSLGILFIFVGLSIFFKICDAYEKKRSLMKPRRKKRLIILLSVLFVWFFLCATDKLMALTIFSVPVMGAVFLERFLDKDTKIKNNWFYGAVLAVMITATISGYIASTALAGDITAGYADGYSNFSKPDDWLENFLKFPLSWINLLGVTAKEGDPFMEFDGVLNLIRIAASLFLLIVPFIALFMYPKIKERTTRIIIIVHFIVSSLIMTGFVFGALSSAEWRLSPIVCTAVMTTVAFGKWVYENMPLKRLGGLIAAPQLCVCLIAFITICGMPYDYGRDRKLYAVAEYLEDQGLDYGYATFWNANPVTAISNDKVKVRCIYDVDGGLIIKNFYQSRTQWYIPEPGQDKFFLLLTRWEYQQLESLGSSTSLHSKKYKKLEYNEYVILVFDENILTA